VVVQAKRAQDDDVDEREDADREEDLVVYEDLVIHVRKPGRRPIGDVGAYHIEQKKNSCSLRDANDASFRRALQSLAVQDNYP
jgi:hypothetical protein